MEAASLREIAVLGDDTKIVRFGVFPNLVVGSLRETERANVRGIRKKLGETYRQPMAEILIEQQFHAAEPTR